MAKKRTGARKAVRAAPKTRRKSKFKVTASLVKKRFKDRFQKFYYLHRDDLNRYRRREYLAKKRKGVCVKCALKRIGKSIFCKRHLKLSRVYNRRRSGA